MDASIFDSGLSHTRRSDASEKREENSVSTFGSFRLWTSFESSPVSVKLYHRFQRWLQDGIFWFRDSYAEEYILKSWDTYPGDWGFFKSENFHPREWELMKSGDRGF